MTHEPEEDGPAQSWAKRRLCPDGGCVGVVRADGRCGLCGKVDESAPEADDDDDAQVRGADGDGGADGDDGADGDGADGADGDGADGDGADGDGADGDGADGDGGADDWDRRELCPDGACTGLIRDGRCSTCGRAAE